MGKKIAHIIVLAGAAAIVLIGFQHGKAADPQPADDNCRKTTNQGPCYTAGTGPDQPPCTNCWAWRDTTAGTVLNCEPARTGLARCGQGLSCWWWHEEYECDETPEGDPICREREERRREGEVPTSIATGGPCEPKAVNPPEEPVEPQ